MAKKTTSRGSTTRKARRPAEDKSIRSAEDKLASEQATLERDATFSGARDDRQHIVKVCRNPNCSDYGVERRGGEPCECRAPGGANHR